MAAPSIQGNADATTTARGVEFPADASGRRSTGSLARDVVAEALSSIDPNARRRMDASKNWRKDYVSPFVEMVACGVNNDSAYRTVSSTALHTLQSRMVGITGRGEIPMKDYLSEVRVDDANVPDTETIEGTGEAATELAIPYRGSVLRGAALAGQIEKWRAEGVIEPSTADKLLEVQQHPEWLSLPGREVAVLGIGSEMGPGNVLLSWGATVLAVDLPSSKVWAQMREQAGTIAGTLRMPTYDGEAGIDLLTQLPETRAWISAAAQAPVTLGTYLYADGGTHVKLSSASDALAAALFDDGTVDALAYLATPMDTFVVPGDVHAESNEAFEKANKVTSVRGALGRLTMGKGFARNYPVGSGPAVHDALVTQQGPNYTLAKRVQRWRATEELAKGRRVSINVAPATRTRSVLKNKALAAVYKGAHHFGIEIFDPETSQALLAALLVHDLSTEQPTRDFLWEHEADGASSGGLWRQPYIPRSALPAAAAIGMALRGK